MGLARFGVRWLTAVAVVVTQARLCFVHSAIIELPLLHTTP